MLACPNAGLDFLNAASVLVLLTPLSFGLLTIPAYLAMRRLVRRRFSPALVRGSLERLAVLVAALAGACAAVAYADGMAAASGGSEAAVGGEYLLAFVASVPLGAIPWAAGELASGASERQGLAFLSSVAAASVLRLSAFLLLEASSFHRPSAAMAPLVLLQLAATGFAALGAACAYLALRGGAVESAPPEAVAMERVLSDYSSSMSENRSLRGCSSGFF
jgi:hypothetical protein